MTFWCVKTLKWCRKMAVHKCHTFRLKWKNLLSPTPDACCPLLALRSIQLMTGVPRPRYSTLQLLGESGACGTHLLYPQLWLPFWEENYLLDLYGNVICNIDTMATSMFPQLDMCHCWKGHKCVDDACLLNMTYKIWYTFFMKWY